MNIKHKITLDEINDSVILRVYFYDPRKLQRFMVNKYKLHVIITANQIRLFKFKIKENDVKSLGNIGHALRIYVRQYSYVNIVITQQHLTVFPFTHMFVFTRSNHSVCNSRDGNTSQDGFCASKSDAEFYCVKPCYPYYIVLGERIALCTNTRFILHNKPRRTHRSRGRFRAPVCAQTDSARRGEMVLKWN